MSHRLQIKVFLSPTELQQRAVQTRKKINKVRQVRNLIERNIHPEWTSGPAKNRSLMKARTQLPLENINRRP